MGFRRAQMRFRFSYIRFRRTQMRFRSLGSPPWYTTAARRFMKRLLPFGRPGLGGSEVFRIFARTK